MKSLLRIKSLQVAGLAVAALLAASLACSGGANVAPNNPEVIKSIVVEGLSFTHYVEQLGILPAQRMAPWIVSPVSPVQGGGTISFSGWGPTQEDLKSNDAPMVVLYEALLNGCDAMVLPGRQLATTSSSSSNEWELANIEMPPDVAIVGAAVRFDNQVGPLGNLVVVNSNLLKAVVSTPAQNQQVGFKTNVTGEAMPGLCVELWRDAQYLGKNAANDKRKWEITAVPIVPGENLIEVRVWVHGESNLYTSFENYKITGPVPIVWPFGEMENNAYMPDTSKGYVTAWYGFNDYYMNNYKTLKTNFHSGLDIGGVSGQIVRSVADGTIKKANLDETDNNYCGISVVVEHDGGWITRYCHLKEIDKALLDGQDEQIIQAGTPLGTAGCTGQCKGDHLHLDVFYGWKSINLNPSDVQSLLAFTGTESDKTTVKEPEMKYCHSNSNIWNLDWSSVKYKEDDGTSFSQLNSCPEGQTCECEP